MVLGKPIICNKVENKRAVIELFYLEESDEWHEKIHKNSGTVQENIDSTLATISEESEMYEVDCNGELAAFFVRYEDNIGLALEGFHVGKGYRNKEFFSAFWKIVKEKMGGTFYAGIYEKNKSAWSHLLKQGFEVVSTIEDKLENILILKINL